MSDLINTSQISRKSADDQSSTDNESQDNFQPHNMSVSTLETIINEMLNNSKPNNDTQNEQQINQIYNKTKETDDNQQIKPEENLVKNDNNVEIKRSLSLVIPRHSIRIVNDFAKTQTPDVTRNSTQATFPTVDINNTSIVKQNQMVISKENNRASNHDDMNKQKQINRPIMGKNALLKKPYVDSTDSLIVQDIVLGKYTPVLNHYVNRMNQRRLSRTRLDSCDDDFSDAPCSSNTSYSPLSTSSPESEHHRFVFPGVSEVKKERQEVQNISERRINKCQRSDSFKTALSEVDLVKDLKHIDDTMYSSSVVSIEGTIVSDYDPEKFLQNAIGDLTSLSESGMSSRTSQKYDNSTMNSSDVSDLVSKLSSLYSSVKNGIKKRRSSLNPNQFQPIGEQAVNKSSSENPHLEILKKELAMQNQISLQISKALTYCRSSNDFINSTEHIEAERILLVTLITKDALINEINSIEFNNYQNIDDPRNKGDIEVTSIKFLPNENNIDSTNELDHDSINEYFLVVLSSGAKVISSKVLTTDEKGLLEIDQSFMFKNLSADFEISFTVYSMLAKDRERMIQERANCLSPRNIFGFHKESRKTYRVINEVPYIKTSAFRLLGRCCIRNAELSGSQQYYSLTLHDCPVHSRISPCFTAKITSKNCMAVKVTGFLTVGIDNEKSCAIWNRRWCVLENFELKYWAHPSEESSSPSGLVDMRYCIEQKISSVDRSACARPRTLLVPIKINNATKKYLLSADSAKDMDMWERELNFVLKSLTTWNCMS